MLERCEMLINLFSSGLRCPHSLGFEADDGVPPEDVPTKCISLNGSAPPRECASVWDVEALF